MSQSAPTMTLAALVVAEDPQEAGLAGLADEFEPVLLAPPPSVPPEDVAQGSAGATVAEETCPPVEQVPMPPSSHPCPRAEALFWAASEASRPLLCAPSEANLNSTRRRVASSRPHAAWPIGNVRSRKLASSSDAAPVGGRPQGFRSCWLMNKFVESREEHWSAEVLRGAKEAARAELKRLPGGTVLLACLRARVGRQPP